MTCVRAPAGLVLLVVALIAIGCGDRAPVAEAPAGPTAGVHAGPGHASTGPEHLTPAELAAKVDSSLAAIATDHPFDVETATVLVRVLNTLFLAGGERTPSEHKLEQLIVGPKFFARLTEALGVSIPNRGMGLYFKEHDLQWGGALGNIRERDAYVIDRGPQAR